MEVSALVEPELLDFLNEPGEVVSGCRRGQLLNIEARVRVDDGDDARRFGCELHDSLPSLFEGEEVTGIFRDHRASVVGAGDGLPTERLPARDVQIGRASW